MVFRKNGRLTEENEVWTFEGEKVEAVNSYEYLGMAINPFMDWSSSVESLVRKATRTKFHVMASLKKFGNLNPETILKIFDSKVFPYNDV